jgi:diguanylate cyclase
MASRLASRLDRSLPLYAVTFFLGLVCASVLRSWISWPAVTPALRSTNVSRDALSFDWVWQPYLLLSVAVLVIACGIAMLRQDQPAQTLPPIKAVATLPFGLAPQVALEDRSRFRGPNPSPSDPNLERQFADLIALVSTYLGGNDKHFASVANVESRLASANSIEQVRLVVEQLIVLNAAAQANARALKISLDEAKSQTLALHEQLSRAETLATFDELTSVANRRKFLEVLEHEVEKSHSYALPLCVVMADIDLFKNINDTLGHPAGDGVIRDFAKLLASNLRPSDLVARYGGEEFAIILPKTALGSAVSLVEQMRLRLTTAKFVDASTNRVIGNVTASFGIAAIQDGEPSSDLVRRADRMLYQAKANGRNRTEVDGFGQA